MLNAPVRAAGAARTRSVPNVPARTVASGVRVPSDTQPFGLSLKGGTRSVRSPRNVPESRKPKAESRKPKAESRNLTSPAHAIPCSLSQPITSLSCPSGFTFSNTWATFPSFPITNVTRAAPMYLRPYMLFSCHTP